MPMFLFPSLAVILMLVLTTASGDNSYIVFEAAPSTSESEEVLYSCKVKSLWTENRHPNLYPSKIAKWKTPILFSHRKDFELWLPNHLASQGLERYAETGSYNKLIIEILDAGEASGDIQLARDFFANVIVMNNDTADNSQYQYQFETFPNLAVVSDSPYISAVASMYPASDWFTGFYNFSAIDLSTNKWYSSFSIQTFPMDAGTETGDSYNMGNVAEVFREPIEQLTIDTIPVTTAVLLSPGSTVLPVAEWTCRLVDVPSALQNEAVLENESDGIGQVNNDSLGSDENQDQNESDGFGHVDNNSLGNDQAQDQQPNGSIAGINRDSPAAATAIKSATGLPRHFIIMLTVPILFVCLFQ